MMRFLIFKKVLILIISILVFSNSHANEVEYEDWAGLYFPKYKYEKNLIKIPDFTHFFNAEETDYIIILQWKGKLILQSRTATEIPLRFGYFDSEIKNPYKSEQILGKDKCKVKLNLKGHKLLVEMNSIYDCHTRVNISGEYIKYGFYKESILKQKAKPKEELFLGKFYNEDICDKATQFKSDTKDLMWTKDKVLKEFVIEAKRRKLDCVVKPYQF